MTQCVCCGERSLKGKPLKHNILDITHLGRHATMRSPTIAAQIIENMYKQVAGEKI